MLTQPVKHRTKAELIGAVEEFKQNQIMEQVGVILNEKYESPTLQQIKKEKLSKR